MRNWTLPLTMLLLGGCANLQAPETAVEYAGTITPTLLDAQSMEVRLEGRRFTGTWNRSKCFTDACRDGFRNVPRMYRRHVYRGHALLRAADGTGLECEWAGYRERLEGACGLDDGREFRLTDAAG